MSIFKPDYEALDYFVNLICEGKIKYIKGELWKYWEPRRGWLDKPKRAEKRMSNNYYGLATNVKSNGRYYCVMAHRVVWSYFNGDIPENLMINHINGIKTDNRIENLELVTCQENIDHSNRNGMTKRAKGLNSGRGKLSDDDVREIRNLLSTGNYTQKEIADMYNVRPNQVSRIKTGARRSDAMNEKIQTFNDYQNLSKRTLNQNLDFKNSLCNYALGLAGESGEVVELLKKSVFHCHEFDRNRLAEELGDIMFYISSIATITGVDLDDVATSNYEKLLKRYPEGFSSEDSINRVE